MLDRFNSAFIGSTTAPRKSPADIYLHLLLQARTQLLSQHRCSKSGPFLYGHPYGNFGNEVHKTLEHENATTMGCEKGTLFYFHATWLFHTKSSCETRSATQPNESFSGTVSIAHVTMIVRMVLAIYQVQCLCQACQACQACQPSYPVIPAIQSCFHWQIMGNPDSDHGHHAI